MKLVVLSLLCVIASPAAARQVLHNARDGETLEILALRYYGNDRLSASIGTHNSLRGELTPGSVIEIPLADEHVVQPGDDWGTLAARYWGDQDLAAAMPQLVEPADPALEAGTKIEIPALIHHRVKPGENLAVLARRSYGDSDRALAIAALNGIENPDRLYAEQQLRLPVFGGNAAPAPISAPPPLPVLLPLPQPVQQSRASPAPVASADLAQALADAIETYHQGEFGEARSALETLRPPVLESGTPEQQQALLDYLLRVHTAFDDAELSCQSLRELQEHEGSGGLDPELFSPKVLELVASCP